MYLDCASGVAGDMLLGALIDVGLPADTLRRALGSLGVGHELRITRVLRSGITATKVDVIAQAPPDHSHDHQPDQTHRHGETEHHGHTHAHGDHGHRTLKEIAHLIGHSALSDGAKDRARRLMRRIAEAEAAIHGMGVDEVHLHEVGAVDSIIDVVGVVFALEWFGVDDIVSSPLNVGGGTVEMAHGRFPVPAPATVALLTGVPVYSDGPRVELVTPTGALLVSSYARAYGPMPAMTVQAVGYGAGTRDFPQSPNVVRVVIGERVQAGLGTPSPSTQPSGLERVVKIECEIDDMNPQLFGVATDRLFEAGALDVFLTPVQMKKGRPGTLMTVLGSEDRRTALIDVLFRETTTIGVRFESMQRETLDRRWIDVTVTGGRVRIKVAERAGQMLNAAPEFDDCERIAASTGRTIKDIQIEAMTKFRQGSS